jgi:hypothetical protein
MVSNQFINTLSELIIIVKEIRVMKLELVKKKRVMELEK